MAKDKTKGKHLQARISYLKQAATYFTLRHENDRDIVEQSTNQPRDQNFEGASTIVAGEADPRPRDKHPQPQLAGQRFEEQHSSGGLPKYLTNHLTQVARKSQIRLQPSVKHTICKRCGNTLIEGETSKKMVENLSRGGKKSHADVLIIECSYCNAQRRFPIGMQRQKKKSERQKKKMDMTDPLEDQPETG